MRANAEPRTHDGFQFRGTLGPGYLCDFETTEAPYSQPNTICGVAGTSEFFFGGTLLPRVTVGGFLGVTFAPDASATHNGGYEYPSTQSAGILVTLGWYVDYYFDQHRGLHVLGTAGLGGAFVAPRESAATGFAVGGGVGYDWWIGSESSFGILARLQYGRLTPTESGLRHWENTIAPTIAVSIVYQ